MTDGYNGNSRVKKDGIEEVFNRDQLQEYAKCMADPVYFVENYMKVLHLDRGEVNFELYPYQRKMFRAFNSHRFNIVLACRQSGKSLSSVGYILWYAIFKPNQKIAILANKYATAKEMLNRITFSLENIPKWMQPGTKGLNKGSIEFSNGSEIFASATTGSSIRGRSCVTGDTRVCVIGSDDLEYHTTIDNINEGKPTKVKKILTEKGFRNFKGFIDQGISEDILLIEFDDSSSIKATRDHRFLRGDEFVEAGHLTVGDTLSGKRITSITESEPERVYDAYEVEETHSYVTNGVVSHNCNLIYLDEFAFVENSETFYTSTYPVISSGESTKVIITSTSNGIGNMFYKLWQGAVSGTNEFHPFRVDWWDVPGRDEAWKKQTIGNTSELQFEQEFGNSFIGATNTLISTKALLGLVAESPTEKNTDVGLYFYKKPVKDHYYITVVDVSKGRGQDYTTFTVIDASTRPFQQVCTFRNNIISPLVVPEVITKISTLYNKALVIVENNDVGQVVANAIYYDLEYENMFLESSVKRGGVGVTMNKLIKRIGCSNLKDLIETGNFHVCDANTIVELSSFISKGESFEASSGMHDDLVMNLVMFAWFVSSEAYGNYLTDKMDLKTLLFDDMNDDDLIPAGFFDGDNAAPMSGYDSMVNDLKNWGT